MRARLCDIAQIGHSLASGELTLGFDTDREKLSTEEMRIDEHGDDARVMDEESFGTRCLAERHIGFEGMERQCFEESGLLAGKPLKDGLHLMACEDELARDIERQEDTLVDGGEHPIGRFGIIGDVEFRYRGDIAGHANRSAHGDDTRGDMLLEEFRDIREGSEGEDLRFGVFFDEILEQGVAGEGYLWDLHPREVLARVSEAIESMDMARIWAFRDRIRFPDRYIEDTHEFTGTEGVPIGDLRSDVATRGRDGANPDDSLLVESESPEQGKKIVSAGVTIDDNGRNRGLHSLIRPYFALKCKVFIPFQISFSRRASSR